MPQQKNSFRQSVVKALGAASESFGFVSKAAAPDTAPAPRVSMARAGAGNVVSVLGNGKLGVQKPTNITFEQLREIAKYDSVIRICTNKIKKCVSQSKWDIVPRKGFTKNLKNMDRAQALFMTINQNGESFRSLLDQVLEDILVLDAGCIEKVYNAKGEIVELYGVDGATIRPKFDASGAQNPESAFVQVINGKNVAEFGKADMMYIMANPKTDVYHYGYGESGIESILLQVNAALQADMYNARAFASDNVPPGLLDIGDRTDEEAAQFAELYNATVIGNTQQIKMIWGSEGSATKFIPFNKSNKDMQYIEYIDQLTRTKLAVYGLSPLDANLTQDVNRSTAEALAELSNSEGVLNNKRLIEEYMNRDILMAMGINDCELQLERSVSLSDKKKQADIDKIYIETGVQAANQIAEREGFVVDSETETPEEDVTEPDETDDIIERSKKKAVNYPPIYTV